MNEISTITIPKSGVIEQTSMVFTLLFKSMDANREILHPANKKDDPFWVFNFLTQRSFIILQRSMTIPIGLVESLRNDLRKLIGPALQAEYSSFILTCEEQGVIDKKRSPEVEVELRKTFLLAMQNHGLDRFFKTYQFLEKSTQSIIKQWIRNTKRLESRFKTDKELLQEHIKSIQSVTKLPRSISGGLSDPHNGHDYVSILSINKTDKVVYKPRSLAAELHFYQFISYLNESSKGISKIYVPWIVDKKSYGWAEYIKPHNKIPSGFDTKAYAEQFGTLCALWYVLGGTDLHEENVIFGENGVVIVDCETIFEADFWYLNRPAIIHRPLVEPEAYLHSILGTLALSVLASDLNPKKENIQQIAGITRFRKLYEKSLKSHGYTQNQISQKWAKFSEYTAHAVQRTLSYITRHDEEINRAIRSCFYDETYCRRIMRSTSVYSAILYNLKNNPKALMSKRSARHYVLQQLQKAPALPLEFNDDKFIVRSEVNQLLACNIPYFGRELNKSVVTTFDGFHAQFSHTVQFLSTKHRLHWLTGATFIKGQAELTSLALSPESKLSEYTRTTPDRQKIGFYHAYGRPASELLQTLQSDTPKLLHQIAEDIKGDILHLDEPKYAYMVMTVEQSKRVCTLMANSYSLFSGLAGKLLYLGLFGAIQNDSESQKITAREAARYIKLGQDTAYIQQSTLYGPMAGYQSLLFTLKCLQDIGIVKTPLSNDLQSAFDKISGKPATYDLVDSLPGSILLGSAYKKDVPYGTLQNWRTELKYIMRTLISDLETGNAKKPFGLAHGPLGTCLAACRLQELTKKTDLELKDLTLRILEQEAKQSRRRRIYSWCYGTPGRALTYHKVGTIFNKPDLMRKAKQMASLSNSHKFQSHTLCCGSLGYIAAHLSIYEYYSVEERMNVLYNFYQNPRNLLMHQKDSDKMPTSLFYGSAGLGLVVLYAMRPDIVPPVWLFMQANNSI